MGPVFQMMRQGLAALLASLPLLALGAGNAAAPASSDPDAALAAVFKDIERSRLSDALEKVDTLIQRYPNFRLAHLIRGDLLLARSRPLPSFGGSPDAPADKLSDLREEAVARLKAYRNRPPNNYVPRYLLQMEAEQKYAIVVDTQKARLYIYQNDDGRPRFVADYYISHGKLGAENRIEAYRTARAKGWL